MNQISFPSLESENSNDVPGDEYGYEDAAPDESHGNEDDCLKQNSASSEYIDSHAPRRSSMKGANGSMPRRASMGSSSTTVVEVRVRGNRFPVQRRRSIDFSKTIHVKEVTPIPAMAEIGQVWLQEEDFAEMKRERRTLVQKVKRGEVGREQADMRGLEKYVDKTARKAKNLAWDTVLLEQDEQELSGIYNDQRIADLYKDTTSTSPEKAVARAKQDEAEVQEYLMSPRTTKLMMRRLSC